MNHSSPPQSEKLASDKGVSEDNTSEVQSDGDRKQTTIRKKEQRCPGCDGIVTKDTLASHVRRLRQGMPCYGRHATHVSRLRSLGNFAYTGKEKVKCLYCDQKMGHTDFHKYSWKTRKVGHLQMHVKTALTSERISCPFPGCKKGRKGLCVKCPDCSDIVKSTDIHTHMTQRHADDLRPSLQSQQERPGIGNRVRVSYRCVACQTDFTRSRKVLHDRKHHPFHDSRIACYRCGEQFPDYQTAVVHLKTAKLCLTMHRKASKDAQIGPSTSSAIVPESLPALPNFESLSSTDLAAPSLSSIFGDSTTTTSTDMRHMTDEPGTSIPNGYSLSHSDVISPIPSLECRYCAKRFAKGVNLRAHEKIKHKNDSASLSAIGVVKEELGETGKLVGTHSTPLKVEVKQEASDFVM